MSVRLTAVSNNANPQRFAILSEGAFVTSINATAVDATNAPRAFYADLPSTLGTAGKYQFVLYRTTGSAQSTARAVGDFFWSGSEIVNTEATEVTTTEIAAIVAAAVADIKSGQGLTDPQKADLKFLRDVQEADEQYVLDAQGAGTAKKMLKGTTTVLINKTVASTPACEQNTTITEAP